MDELWRGNQSCSRSGRRLPAELSRLAVEDELHQLIGIDGSGGQRPGEALDSGQLPGRAARPLMTPEADEAADGPAAAAQPANLAPGSGFAGNRTREVLGLLDEPLDEHTGLRIPKAAGQGIVRQDVA